MVELPGPRAVGAGPCGDGGRSRRDGAGDAPDSRAGGAAGRAALRTGGAPRRRVVPRRDEGGDGGAVAAAVRRAAPGDPARRAAAGAARLHRSGAGGERARLPWPPPAPRSRCGRRDERRRADAFGGDAGPALHDDAGSARGDVRDAVPGRASADRGVLAAPAARWRGGGPARGAGASPLRSRGSAVLLRAGDRGVDGLHRRDRVRARRGDGRGGDADPRCGGIGAGGRGASGGLRVVRDEPLLPGGSPRRAGPVAVGWGERRLRAHQAVHALGRRPLGPRHDRRLPAGGVGVGQRGGSPRARRGERGGGGGGHLRGQAGLAVGGDAAGGSRARGGERADVDERGRHGRAGPSSSSTASRWSTRGRRRRARGCSRGAGAGGARRR